MGWVRSVAVEPGNQWFATGAGDRVIKVFFRGQAYMQSYAKQCALCVDLGFGIGGAETFVDWSYLGCSGFGCIDKTSVFVFVW